LGEYESGANSLLRIMRKENLKKEDSSNPRRSWGKSQGRVRQKKEKKKAATSPINALIHDYRFL